MTHNNRVRLSKLTLGLLAVLATAPVFAQSTSAGVGGRVVGADGQPVANAEVVIVHTESGTVSRAITGPDGRYNARGLRVGGPYTITTTAPGAGAGSQEGLYLNLDQVSQVDLSLNDNVTTLGSVQAIAVGGSEIFSSDKVGAGTLVTRETIDRLPSIGRNIQDYIRLDPRIAQTDKERSEISAGGQNIRFNNIRVDGVTINDGFGLEGNNLVTSRQPVSIDAIEEINISLANYDVSVSGYTGANVDAVTKSGTNKFSGTLFGVYRDGDWARDDIIPRSFFSPPQEEQTYGATFGGPLVKDRLFFFVSYENFERTLGAPSILPSGISNQQIGRVQQIARDVHGFDAGAFALPSELTFEVEDVLARIDWNISDNQRAYFRYNKSEQSEPFLRNIGSRSLSLSSFWQTNNKEFESAVVQLFSDWTENFSTEFKLGRSDSSSLWQLNSRLPQIQICLSTTTCSGVDSIFIGAEQFRHVNILETETTTAFGAGTVFAGDHEVKFGAEYQANDIFNLFGRDQFGVYQFRGIDAFAAGTPSQFSVRYPINGDINSIAAEFKLENLGFFIQDTWRVSNNLTVNYGLRLDVPKIDDRPPANPGASAVFGFDNTNTIDGNELLQPRAGFNYTFDSDRPTQLRGGLGLFAGTAANVWLANPFQNNGGVTLGEFFSSSGAGIVFSPDPDNQPGSRQNPNAPTLNGPLDLIDPNLKQPAVWKANLAIDHELPWWSVVASAELLLTSVEEAIYYENLNLGAASFQTQDGRLLYWGNPFAAANGSFNTGSANARGNRDRRFTDVTVARPTSKGRGEQLTVSLNKPRIDTWSWSLAYTFTSAEEVNPLTSSQAISNWGNSFRLNHNDNVAVNSIYAIRDRFSATLGWEKKFFGDYKTSVAAFYEGRSGRPFSYSYINDANGDGRTNDLLYVPSGPGDVIFTGGAAMESAFFQYLANNPDLARFAGGTAEASAGRSPFVNNIDLRFTQELPGLFDGHKSEIWVDVLNIGNLINKDWGQIEEVGFPYGKGIATFAGIDRATGKYRYTFNESNIRDLTLRDNRGESRWALQVGFRYRF
ncbi:MAG: TonB-dependent receptor [Lysobacter sp.]|nr:TonB-dependent receptor [Lysobacter sp.]